MVWKFKSIMMKIIEKNVINNFLFRNLKEEIKNLYINKHT